ncbi:MAG TPA: response regulator [Steroidobacteraceae bacterium]|nr:response regulator [Steroidobacteraceae bacterium]
MEQPVPATQEIGEKRTTILLVEDELLLRWPAAEYLRDAGHRVIEAATVGEAIAVLSSVRIDIVFSDVNLGDEQSGHELAQWLGLHRPGVPLLLTSADGTARDLTSMAPIRRFLPKPYDLAQVAKTLKEMLASK